MRLRIAVTDNDWFRFLRGLPDVDEVNFWQPSGERTFRALEPGELLFFKLHHPTFEHGRTAFSSSGIIRSPQNLP